MAQKISGPFKNYKRTLRFSTEPHFSRLYFSTEDALKLIFNSLLCFEYHVVLRFGEFLEGIVKFLGKQNVMPNKPGFGIITGFGFY